MKMIFVGIAKQLHANQEVPVTLTVNGQFFNYNLDEMLQQITSKNRHHIIFDDYETSALYH